MHRNEHMYSLSALNMGVYSVFSLNMSRCSIFFQFKQTVNGSIFALSMVCSFTYRAYFHTQEQSVKVLFFPHIYSVKTECECSVICYYGSFFHQIPRGYTGHGVKMFAPTRTNLTGGSCCPENPSFFLSCHIGENDAGNKTPFPASSFL